MAANRPKCCVCGVASVTEAFIQATLAQRIGDEMSSLDFIGKHYPMLCHWGVRDEDVLLHSLGCSAWNALGLELGFMAVTECPAPTTHGADIRPDSTWFDRQQKAPAVLIEFERYDGSERGQKKLDEKLCNLLEARRRWGNTPSVLILSAWSKAVVSAPNKAPLVQRCHGFTSSTGIHIAGHTTVLLNRFIFELEQTGTLLLKQIRCESLL